MNIKKKRRRRINENGCCCCWPLWLVLQSSCGQFLHSHHLSFFLSFFFFLGSARNKKLEEVRRSCCCYDANFFLFFTLYYIDIPAQVPPLTPGTNKKMTEALKASFASWEKEQERLGIPKGNNYIHLSTYLFSSSSFDS